MRLSFNKRSNDMPSEGYARDDNTDYQQGKIQLQPFYFFFRFRLFFFFHSDILEEYSISRIKKKRNKIFFGGTFTIQLRTEILERHFLKAETLLDWLRPIGILCFLATLLASATM